jgi:2'-5' RNA ligase
MLRLFFALVPSPEMGASVLATAAPLMAELQTEAVPRGNLHATLSFVGAVAPERLDALCAAAASVRGKPFDLVFDSFQYWSEPRVLIAGVSRESEEANALTVALREAAIAAGFAPDIKPFRAHLTLARKISAEAAAKFSWPLKISPGFVVRCEKFALMESRRSDGASIYSAVDEWHLYEK